MNERVTDLGRSLLETVLGLRGLSRFLFATQLRGLSITISRKEVWCDLRTHD